MPHGSRLRSVAASLLLGTLLVGVLATPAAAAGASPKQWARSVCATLDSWVDDLGAASGKVAESKPRSAANVRKKLTGLLALAQRKTNALLDDLRAAGRPDVKGGKQIAATIHEGFAQVQRTIVDAKKTLAKASTKDPQAFMDSTRSVQDALEAGLEGVQAAFSATRTADVGPLLAAFAADKRCETVAA